MAVVPKLSLVHPQSAATSVRLLEDGGGEADLGLPGVGVIVFSHFGHVGFQCGYSVYHSRDVVVSGVLLRVLVGPRVYEQTLSPSVYFGLGLSQRGHSWTGLGHLGACRYAPCQSGVRGTAFETGSWSFMELIIVLSG